MIHFKTKTEIQIPLPKSIVTGYLYYTIEEVNLGENNLTPINAYFYYMKDGYPYEVYRTKTTVIAMQTLKALEAGLVEDVDQLPPLPSSVHLIDDVKQRCSDMFYKQIDIDASKNLSFNTVSSDWELFTPIIEE